MPRGDNPNSRANLAKSKGFNTETARKAKKKSDESKRANASLTEAIKTALTPERAKKIADIVVNMAERGNLKAYELVRDQMGEKPTEKIAVAAVNEDALGNLKEAIAKRKKNGTE